MLVLEKHKECPPTRGRVHKNRNSKQGYVTIRLLVLHGLLFASFILAKPCYGREFQSEISMIQSGDAQKEPSTSDTESLQKDEDDNNLCEIEMAMLGQIEAELNHKKNLLDTILDKLEEKADNHLLCDHLKNQTQNYCLREANNGTAKCGGQQYDDMVLKYVNTKGCLNSLVLSQSLIYQYTWPEEGSAFDKWIKQYSNAMFSGGVGSELSKIYLKSMNLMTDMRDDIRKTLKAFSTNELKEIWKERKWRIVGVMCLVGDGETPEIRDQIMINDDLVVIKLQFDDLIKRAVSSLEKAFDQFGVFIDNLNKKNGYIDQLKEIHKEFHVFRMKKLSPALESSPQSSTVLNSHNLMKKLPHIEQRNKRKLHKKHKLGDTTETNLLQRGVQHENSINKMNAGDDFVDPSSFQETNSLPPLSPPVAQPGLEPISQSYPLTGSLNGNPLPNVPLQPLVDTPSLQPLSLDGTLNAPINNHQLAPNVNSTQGKSENAVNPQNKSNVPQQVQSSKSVTSAPLEKESEVSQEGKGVSLNIAIQEAIIELNLFKVENNTVKGELDKERIKKSVESSFLDIKDTECLMKMFFAPQAVLVTIIQLFEQFTPDPTIDLREWYNKTMNEGGMITDGAIDEIKGPNMTHYVNRFSEYIDTSYQTQKRKSLYQIDNLAELTMGEPMLTKDTTKQISTIEFLMGVHEDNSQSFVDSSNKMEWGSQGSSSCPVALVCSEQGICPAKQFSCPNPRVITYTVDGMTSQMVSSIPRLTTLTLSSILCLAVLIINWVF